MTKYIMADEIPEDVEIFLTPGKRYEVFDEINHRDNGEYQVYIINDDGVTTGPININWPCSYLDDGLWTVVED